MARTPNPENEQMKILEDPEDDDKMLLGTITIRGAENVEGKSGYIVTCSYRMKPEEINDDTPYEQRHKSEDYISTTKEKALAYVEEKLPKLCPKLSDGL